MIVSIARQDAPKGVAEPSDPTSAPPGSKVKLEVMQSRLERGECLFHPMDCAAPFAP